MPKDGVTAKVEGLEKAIANLKKYPLVKTQAVKDVLKETGFKIEASAKKDGNCPVDSGRLRASISTNWSGSSMNRGKTGSQAKSEDGVGRPGGKPGLTVVVGSNVKYAHIQEFSHWGDATKPGPGDYPSKKGRKHEPRKRPAEGFLYLTKAYHKNEPEGLKRIKTVLKKKETL